MGKYLTTGKSDNSIASSLSSELAKAIGGMSSSSSKLSEVIAVSSALKHL
jgi:hypothetical protein